MAMRRRHWIFLLAFAVYVVSIVSLARLESGLPPHTDLELAGGLPATLYLPGVGNPFYSINPPASQTRRPVVILIHGYAEDRRRMSSLARRIALNGYAVLAIEVRGHGENRKHLIKTV
jgi:pimeloyl-ACP methyl ester carboxylesterase